MAKLIEITHVGLGGQVDPLDWLDGSPGLHLADVKPFESGVVLVVYTPSGS